MIKNRDRIFVFFLGALSAAGMSGIFETPMVMATKLHINFVGNNDNTSGWQSGMGLRSISREGKGRTTKVLAVIRGVSPAFRHKSAGHPAAV